MLRLLQRGAEMLASQTGVGLVLVYTSGGLACQWVATPGRTEYQIDDGAGGVRLEHTDRDWLGPGDRLLIGGRRHTPLPGDQIQEFRETETVTYEVLPNSPGMQCYTRSGPNDEMLRVRCKVTKRQ